MRSLKQAAATATILLVALVLTGCEDSGVTAPSDAQIIVSANPGTVVIDTEAGETEGRTTITAQLFDAEGFPLTGVAVTFTADGGTLASAPDPGDPPSAIETDDNGIAVDVLTLALGDDAPVQVTARSGTLTGIISVDKVIDSGNIEPEAIIVAEPTNPNQQQVGLPVVFDGRDSSDPDGQITCYKWNITSSVPANNKVIQGPTRSFITEVFNEEQTLTVELFVSDDPDPGTFCDNCEGSAASCGASSSYFSNDSDVLIPLYEIVCDLTAPLAFVTVTTPAPYSLGGGSLDIDLDGSGSRDDDNSIVFYSWDCDNTAGDVFEGGTLDNVTCNYTVAGTKNPTLTVTNECGLTASRTVQFTVTN